MKDIINTNKFMFYIYLITLLIVVLLSIKIKPFGNPDEGAHFLRAYEISKGHFFNTKGNIGVNISCREYEIIAKKYAPIAFEQQFNKKDIFDEDCYVNSINSAGVYSPFSYILISTGFILSDFMNLGVENKLIFSRLFNGIISITIIFFLTYKINYYKSIFIFITITPMFLVTISSISADSFLFIIIFIVLFLIIRNIEHNSNKSKHFYIFFLFSFFLLGTTKIVYSVISLLLLITFGNDKTKRYYSVVLISIIVSFLSSIFFISISDSNLIYLGNSAIPIEQSRYVLNNFISYIMIVFNSVFNYNVLRNLFFPNYLFGENYFLFIFYPIIYIILALSEDVSIFNTLKRLYTVFICFLIIFLISTSLYLYYNPVGYKMILGLQARYFIPVLIISSFVLPLSKNLFYVSDLIKKSLIIITLFTNIYFVVNL